MHTGSQEMITTMVYIPSNVHYAPRTHTSTFTGALTKGKSSVDVGCFVPGIHRLNPYQVYRQVITDDPVVGAWGDMTSTLYYQTFKFDGQPLSKPLWDASKAIPSLAMYDKWRMVAVTAAYAKVGQSELQLAQELGELKETLLMFKDPLGMLHKWLDNESGINRKLTLELMRYLRTGVWRGRTGKRALEDATSLWLELRYGFRPLLYSLGEVVDYLRKQVTKFDSEAIRSKKRFMSNCATNVSVTKGNYAACWSGLRYEVTTSISDEVTALGAVQFKLQKALGTMSRLGLSPRYWPETAWELTKLSFMWDWIFNIGTVLGALRINPETLLLGDAGGLKVTRNVTCTITDAWISRRRILNIRLKRLDTHRFRSMTVV